MDTQKIIKQLNELYFIQRKHYLIQYKEPVGYIQYTAGQINNKGKKMLPLLDWQFEKHINGEITIGTFSKFFSKFMSFDVDFHDPEKAKWITYKVSKTLDELGIKQYYISYSGNKGYHIDLFFEDLIQIDYAEKFFNYVILQSDILQYFDNANKVEFRITDKMGIKIPLGIHQGTGKFCGFCKVESGLDVMTKEESYDYLYTIEKMNHKQIMDIVGIDCKETLDKKILIKTEDAISQHKPLENYNQSEDYSIDLAMRLLQNGLQVQGSRHKSILLISMYLKYCGLDLEGCKNELHNWMDQQNPNSYTTPIKDCHLDINQVVKDVYERNYNLRSNTKNIEVTYDEIKWIIDNCPEKNQKLIMYSMLIHSKRHANLQGVFYMPFKDMETVTGLAEMTVIAQVNKLIKLGTIEAERNRKPKGKGLQKNLPNLYKIICNINSENLSKENYSTDKTSDFVDCIKFYYTDKELRKILSQRQYKSLVG